MKRNPFDYRLPLMKSWDGNLKAFKPYEKRTKLICKSFMRRARAAYKYAEIAYKDQRMLLQNMTTAACDVEENINKSYEWVMDNLPLRAIKWDDGRTLTQVATEHINYVNKGIQRMHADVQQFEGQVYHQTRAGGKHLYGLQPKEPAVSREHSLVREKNNHFVLKQLFLDLRKAYPYMRQKYRARLSRIVVEYVNQYRHKPDKLDSVNFTAYSMIKLGIPAVDISGPWWPHTDTIKSPMGFIDWLDTSYGDLRLEDGTHVRYSAHSSPTVKSWLTVAGLDEGDRELCEAVFQYYLRHKATPSKEWVRRRSNELEEERMEKEVGEHAETVATWLHWSHEWYMADTTLVPPMPDSTFRILESNDAEALCRTAKKDGLCVIDRIVDLVERTYSGYDDGDARFGKKLFATAKAEGFVTLLYSNDKMRRTVVGLNENGICTSEHQCTGRNNEVDAVAYEYFRQPHGQQFGD